MFVIKNMGGGIVGRLLTLRQIPGLNTICNKLLLLLTCDIPNQVEIGKGVVFMHCGFGTVMYPKVRIGDGAVVYHNVTLGRKYHVGPFGGIEIGPGAMICAGAKVLGGETPLVVGEGAVVAANAVLTHSIPPYEIWGGVPARRIRKLR